MKINSLCLVLMVMFCFTLLTVNDRAESLDISENIQGIVKGIGKNSIEIIEYPNGTAVPILIDPNIEYNNMHELTDLKIGDKIQVECQQKDKKNIATVITKIEVENEDDL